MAETKSTTLTVRVHPAVKDELRAVAEQERQSLVNMNEVMIRDYCQPCWCLSGRENRRSLTG